MKFQDFKMFERKELKKIGFLPREDGTLTPPWNWFSPFVDDQYRTRITRKADRLTLASRYQIKTGRTRNNNIRISAYDADRRETLFAVIIQINSNHEERLSKVLSREFKNILDKKYPGWKDPSKYWS
ncbi:hypothetical protein GX888_00360 [Candidatus Dojkabacteria bacterium]|uniref:Uncharacterized protein n=1 Tax=Candidatus Dojkabacteria bacterium TaxID=2099670 RepID=A0A847VCI8_9BACT|nr:hypothetical protein [Candidatus Dojkabacteria bacterium]